jgi:hypothetical protein
MFQNLDEVEKHASIYKRDRTIGEVDYLAIGMHAVLIYTGVI